DEVLNFLNRHRGMAEQFHAFIQNLTVATMGVTHGAALISLTCSQGEMTDWDMQWQDKITKVVRRMVKALIANDETEISEVVRRRLFEDLGSHRIRKKAVWAFADWCFERRAQLPPEWTAVDTAATEAKARELLHRRFEACYPFHPAMLTLFQRKWQALPQYQQTRGTLAMLAQWISWAYRTGSPRRAHLLSPICRDGPCGDRLRHDADTCRGFALCTGIPSMARVSRIRGTKEVSCHFGSWNRSNLPSEAIPGFRGSRVKRRAQEKDAGEFRKQ
ncbi:MAG: DUF499 domain-containing protein, partial [Thermodesulfobacteriota bacterium]